MLDLFLWLDLNPWFFWTLATLVTGVFLFRVFQPLSTDTRPTRSTTLTFIVVAFLTLLTWRWPTLFDARELNPDESQFIAGALTLKQDPVFWRSVDGTTAGALIFYALLPVHGLGVPLDYFGARLTGMLLLGVTLLGCFLLIRAYHGEHVARISVAPSVMFAALATDADFLHYSSELVPNALLAVAAYLLWQPSMAGKDGHFSWAKLATGGALAGMLPWAKLQSAPLGAMVVVVATFYLWQNSSWSDPKRRIGFMAMCAGALAPTILFGAIIATWADVDDFFRSYLLQNLNYVAPDNRSASILDGLQRSPATTGPVILLLGATAGFALIRVADSRRAALTSIRSLLPATLLLAVAIACIVFPGRSSGHYLWFLLVPCTLLAGSSVGGLLAHRGLPSRHPNGTLLPAGGGTLLYLALIPIALASPIALRLAQPSPEMIGQLAAHWRQPATQLGSLIRTLARPVRSVYVWGWNPAIYVESGAGQGARSAFSVWSIIPNPQKDYFRARDLDDFVKNRPAVFVDAVGPNARMIIDRRQQGHETHPGLAAAVRRDYQLMADVGEARVYLRRDLLKDRQISQTDITKALGRGRISPVIDALPRETVRGFELPQIFAHGREAVGLNPPARIAWKLRGDEREVHFQYGYYGALAEQNTTGNGTEYRVILEDYGGHRRIIDHFYHNPAHLSHERGPQTRRTALPPYRPGSRLEVTTSAGPDNNDAWDWAYLAEVRFLRSASYSFNQFPEYNRLPDHAEAPLAQLGFINGEPYLQLHPPSYLDFVLTGVERHLAFDFGFHPDAFGSVDRTNGAVFIVDLLSLGHSTQRLFEAKLEPITHSEHRGRHSVAINLPEHASGATIRIAVSDNGSAGWDWTYIRNFRLD